MATFCSFSLTTTKDGDAKPLVDLAAVAFSESLTQNGVHHDACVRHISHAWTAVQMDNRDSMQKASMHLPLGSRVNQSCSSVSVNATKAWLVHVMNAYAFSCNIKRAHKHDLVC